MSVLVFVEDPVDELSLQALAFARGLGSEVQAVSIDGDQPYAPAGSAQSIVEAIEERAPDAVLAPGSDRGNEVLAHVAAILDQPLAVNCTALTPGQPATVTRVRWGGSLL
jgi:electron transfer flavoprotein alpha subunit